MIDIEIIGIIGPEDTGKDSVSLNKSSEFVFDENMENLKLIIKKIN